MYSHYIVHLQCAVHTVYIYSVRLASHIITPLLISHLQS